MRDSESWDRGHCRRPGLNSASTFHVVPALGCGRLGRQSLRWHPLARVPLAEFNNMTKRRPTPGLTLLAS